MEGVGKREGRHKSKGGKKEGMEWGGSEVSEPSNHTLKNFTVNFVFLNLF